MLEPWLVLTGYKGQNLCGLFKCSLMNFIYSNSIYMYIALISYARNN